MMSPQTPIGSTDKNRPLVGIARVVDLRTPAGIVLVFLDNGPADIHHARCAFSVDTGCISPLSTFSFFPSNHRGPYIQLKPHDLLNEQRKQRHG